MPAKSRSQQQFFGAELARKREGKKTKTGLSEQTIMDFAATEHTHLPKHAKTGKKGKK